MKNFKILTLEILHHPYNEIEFGEMNITFRSIKMKRILILALALIVSNYGFSQTLTPPPADEQAVAPAIAPAPVTPAPKTDGGTIDGDSLIKKYLIESASGDTIKLPASCKEDELTYINATAKAKADRDLAIAASNKKCDGLVDVATKAFINKLQAAQVVETKKGNLEGALAIKAKVEKMNPSAPKTQENISSINSKPPTFAFLQGKWKTVYVNGATRTYTINNNIAEFTEDTKDNGKISIKGNLILIEFNSRIERITINKNNTLNVEHFNPKSTYPNDVPFSTGTGIRQ